MVDAPKKSTKGKKRSTLLNIWLWLMLIFAVLGVHGNTASIFAADAVGFPAWSGVVLALLGVANIMFISQLMKWQIKGFHGIIGTTVIAFLVNLVIGVGFASALAGFLGPVLLYFFMKPDWKNFS